MRKRLFAAYAAAALGNFAVFVAVAIYIGGDAINGHAQNGRYFLCFHGNCHEVGRALFMYSWWHAISVIVTFIPLVIIGAMSELRPRRPH